jgi:hypothetical protein
MYYHYLTQHHYDVIVFRDVYILLAPLYKLSKLKENALQKHFAEHINISLCGSQEP